MQRRGLISLTIFSLFLVGFLYNGTDERGGSIGMVADDSDRNYTTVGNLALTISNFGTIGTRNSYWPEQPALTTILADSGRCRVI